MVHTQQVRPPWSGHWYQLQLALAARTQARVCPVSVELAVSPHTPQCTPYSSIHHVVGIRHLGKSKAQSRMQSTGGVGDMVQGMWDRTHGMTVASALGMKEQKLLGILLTLRVQLSFQSWQ